MVQKKEVKSMKFFNSDSERRNNTNWNKCVVHMDNIIKDILTDTASLDQNKELLPLLVYRYANNVIAIIGRILTEINTTSFEDMNYVLDYLDSARKQAVDDLEYYRDRLTERNCPVNFDFNAFITALRMDEPNQAPIAPAL